MPQRMKNDFNGGRLRELRLARSWTIRDLAIKINRNYACVSRWESGKNSPSLALRRRLAKVLTVSVREFST
jgi:transcriptional regulator with XRE-family HTH domain